MADGSSFETSLEQIGKKIDEQARFTRSVVIICTLSILGVTHYTLIEIYGSLPANCVMHFMGNMEKIVAEWKLIEASMANRAKKPSLAPAPAPPPAQPSTEKK
jgi:hypothetical protein